MACRGAASSTKKKGKGRGEVRLEARRRLGREAAGSRRVLKGQTGVEVSGDPGPVQSQSCSVQAPLEPMHGHIIGRSSIPLIRL